MADDRADNWKDVRRRQAELEARYEAIHQAWRESGIPTFVLQTPDWKSGWQALLDWLGLHDIRGADAGEWQRICAASWPHDKTAWAHEIHVYSHMHSPMPGHHPAHATIEEEGTRAILAWWQQVRR